MTAMPPKPEQTYCKACTPECKRPALSKVEAAVAHPVVEAPLRDAQIPACEDCAGYLRSGDWTTKAPTLTHVHAHAHAHAHANVHAWANVYACTGKCARMCVRTCDRTCTPLVLPYAPHVRTHRTRQNAYIVPYCGARNAECATRCRMAKRSTVAGLLPLAVPAAHLVPRRGLIQSQSDRVWQVRTEQR